MEERLKALEIAMNREEAARTFYLEASKKVTHPFTQEMFSSFAKDEERHYRTVQKIYTRLKGERAWPKLITSIGDVVITRAVDPRQLETLTMSTEDLTVSLNIVKLGLEREEQSIAFYHQLAEKATDPFESRFFIALEHEERGHYLTLWDYREYLEDPASWHSRKEGFRLDAG
jgi:rubrerythrin